MASWIGIVLLVITQSAVKPASAATDATLREKSTGLEVVRATIRKIQQTCIFPNDFGFMRRIAWVESRFGMDGNTFRDDTATGGKGIWQMDRIGFEDTMRVRQAKLDEVAAKLRVTWGTMTYASANMNVPLYNALAARLLLSLKTEPIPPGVDAQASYWKTHYNTNAGAGTVAGFLSKMSGMPSCQTVGADLLFILDASGSIGDSNFQLMKQVLVEVVNKFTIGRDATQIAVITYESSIQETIGFNQYSAVGPLTSAINALRYTSGGTNTHLALDRVTDMFQSARALDTGFPRVVIVLTDGASNSPALTSAAAANLASISWLERYAVGMGSGINEAELQLIASSPNCTHVYTIQSVSAITALTDDLYDLACRSSAALPPADAVSGYSRMTGTLQPNTPRNARDTAVSRVKGRTYALNVTSGSAILYVSLSSESPGPAFYDYLATATSNRPGVLFISPSVLTASPAGLLSRRRRQLPSNSSVSASGNNTVYLAIVPDAGNQSVSYQLDAHDGDRRSLYLNSAAGRPSNLLWPRLAAVLLLISMVTK